MSIVYFYSNFACVNFAVLAIKQATQEPAAHIACLFLDSVIGDKPFLWSKTKFNPP